MTSHSDALRLMFAVIAAMREAGYTKMTCSSSPATPGSTSRPVATSSTPSAAAPTATT